MSRTTRLVLLFALAQTALVLIYWGVERQRTRSTAPHHLSNAAPQRIDEPLPELELRAPDGSRHRLAHVARPTLVHFWATWCAPCREELPGLLDVPERADLDVVAIALDRDWPAVAAFFDGPPPANVFLADPDAVSTGLGVHTLPVTFLVAPPGKLTARFDGARDWADRDFAAAWLQTPTPGAP